MRVQPGGSDLVASLDGAYVACADNRIALYDAVTHAQLASTPLEAEAEIGFVSSDRLLALIPGDGRTQLVGYALPSLELLAQLELEGRLRPLAFVAGRALVATESLEQPRIVAITSKILVEPIALREPLLLATAAPEERLLVASRTREAQLECWDPVVRRALFRLNLPLTPKPMQAGFAARRRLLWIASGAPQGQLEVFRFSDGRLQARVELGAPFAGAAGHPDSPRLIVATRARDGAPLDLMELDFQQGDRRLLAPATPPSAFCVVEGAAPALVMSNGAALAWLALAPAMPNEPRPAPPKPPVAAREAAKTPHPRVSDSRDWRAKLASAAHDAQPSASSLSLSLSSSSPSPSPSACPSPSASTPSSLLPSVATRARSHAPATSDDGETDAPADATHWRDELCDWAQQLLAAPRRAQSVPPWPAQATLAVLAERLALTERAAQAVALVYGGRLLGSGEGVAAATVARALCHGAPTDDDAWTEALGRGELGQLGLVRLRGGRLALVAAAARFLDGAPPHLALVRGSGRDAELPSGHRRLDGAGDALATIGARLAERFGYDVALLSLDAAPRRALAAQLLEARLHGAWPLLEAGHDPTASLAALDDGPSVIVVRGTPSGALAALPTL